jgi:zinc transport system substrate-binding protein
MRTDYRWSVRRLGILLVALIGLGCGGVGPRGTPTRLVVATSIPPHTWLIEEIGGDRVEVHTVLRPGESPTTHQPSDAQVSRVLSSRVFFRCGVPFESGAWFRALGGHIEIVDLRDGVAIRTMESHTHEGVAVGEGSQPSGAAVDPHIWLSPRRLMVQARLVAATLQRLDPDHARDYAARLAGLIAELEELDAWIKNTLAPYRGRAFVVFHPSWGYFADDYGIRQIAIEIEGKEPSDAELTKLQEETRALAVSVVFVQPQIAGKSARAVAGALGARLETLDPLAPDIVANLRHVTATITESFRD